MIETRQSPKAHAVPWGFHAQTLDNLYYRIYDAIISEGEVRQARGTKSWELRNVSFTQSKNPWLFSLPSSHNKCLAYGELMLNLAGYAGSEAYKFYVPAYENWEVDGVLPGAYGLRFYWVHLQRLVHRLSLDDETRRGVIAIYENDRDLPNVGQTNDLIDVACNLMLHFIPQHGELDLNIFSRSTDFRRGFIYDVSMWSILLGLVAEMVSLKAGHLTFFTSSLHLYAEDRNYLKGIRDRGDDKGVHQDWFEPRENPSNIGDLWKLIDAEREARTTGSLVAANIPQTVATPFIFLPIVQWARNHQDPEVLRFLMGGPFWKRNRDYYEFAAGKLLK